MYAFGSSRTGSDVRAQSSIGTVEGEKENIIYYPIVIHVLVDDEYRYRTRRLHKLHLSQLPP